MFLALKVTLNVSETLKVFTFLFNTWFIILINILRHVNGYWWVYSISSKINLIIITFEYYQQMRLWRGLEMPS